LTLRETASRFSAIHLHTLVSSPAAGDRRSFIDLTPADVQAILEKFNANSDMLPLPDLSAVREEMARGEAAADLDRITESFTPQNLIAGAEILLALFDTFDRKKPGKTCQFARYGYLGWLLAYIAEKEMR
jgi:hypothetical protein